jgi:hypothetical protein
MSSQRVPLALATAAAIAAGAALAALATADLDDAVHAAAAKTIQPWAITPWMLLALALGVGLLAAIAWRLPRPALARAAALWVAAWPASTFLGNLLPWWRAGGAAAQVVVFWLITGGIAAGLVALSRVVSAGGAAPQPADGRVPVPLPAVRGAGWIALVTCLVLAADVATGSALGWGQPLGRIPADRSRSYGFGNLEFALFAAAALIATAVFLGRSSRWRLAVAGGLAGLAAAAMDGLPQLGADFGGTIPIVAGFAVCLALALGARLRPRLVLWCLAGGAGLLAAFAFGDWARGPDHWTHVGAFVDGALHGRGWDIIGRKIRLNLSTTLPGLPVAALLIWVLVRVERLVLRTDATEAFLRALPLARPLFWGLTTMALIGSAMNDSGLGVAAAMGALALPLLAAVFPAAAD